MIGATEVYSCPSVSEASRVSIYAASLMKIGGGIMRPSFLIVSLTLLCSGCASSITVKHVTSNDAELVGVPWNLPMTQFKITITRQITQCQPTLKGSVETIATTALAVDPDQRYLLTSKGDFATSDITSNLNPAGFNTGLNASSVGSTSTIISNIVGAASQLVLYAASSGVATNYCDTPISDAVKLLYPSDQTKGLKAKVEKETADLADATARLALLTAKSVTDNSLKKRIVDAITRQDHLEKKLETDQKALADKFKLTTNTVTITWPTLASQFRTESPFKIDQSVMRHWMAHGQTLTAQFLKPILAQFDVYAAIYRLNTKNGTWTLPTEPAVADTSIGVPVRLAGAGLLLICVQAKCPKKALPADFTPSNTQIVSEFPILQLGQVYVLPVTGGGFKSETATITLNSNGLPTQLQTSEKASEATGITATANAAATQLAALPSNISAAKLAKTQAETNQLTANASLASAQASAGIQGNTTTLNAQAAFIAAQNNLAIAQKNAGMAISTAEVTAQSDLISAQSTLATAQANAGVTGETSALGAQAALVNAQAALINANSTLAKAQTAAP